MIKLKNSTRRFNMNLLSIMFGMQMIKMAVQGFMKSSLTAFEKANGEQNSFNKATNKLRASWEFFKISMIDTLSTSGAFQFLIDLVFNIVNKLNEFMAIHPEAKEWFALGLVFFGISAAILAAWASLTLLSGGMTATFGIISELIGILMSPIGLVLAGIFLIGIIFDDVGKDMKSSLKTFGSAAKDVFRGISAWAKGDSELMTLYFERAAWKIRKGFELIVKALAKLFADLISWLVEVLMAPVFALTLAADKILGTNYTGKLSDAFKKQREQTRKSLDIMFEMSPASTKIADINKCNR